MSSSTPVIALELAVQRAGGQSAFAAALSRRRAERGEDPVTAARVWNWRKRERKAPAEFCPDIEALYEVRCEELAPEVDWAVLRADGAKQAANDDALQGRAGSVG